MKEKKVSPFGMKKAVYEFIPETGE